jgi:hypothetical protein
MRGAGIVLGTGSQGEEEKERKDQQESEAQNANQQGPPPEALLSTDKTQSNVGRQQGQAPKIGPKSGAAARDCSPPRSEMQNFEKASLQKSLQSGHARGKTNRPVPSLLAIT